LSSQVLNGRRIAASPLEATIFCSSSYNFLHQYLSHFPTSSPGKTAIELQFRKIQIPTANTAFEPKHSSVANCRRIGQSNVATPG